MAGTAPRPAPSTVTAAVPRRPFLYRLVRVLAKSVLGLGPWGRAVTATGAWLLRAPAGGRRAAGGACRAAGGPWPTPSDPLAPRGRAGRGSGASGSWSSSCRPSGHTRRRGSPRRCLSRCRHHLGRRGGSSGPAQPWGPREPRPSAWASQASDASSTLTTATRPPGPAEAGRTSGPGHNCAWGQGAGGLCDHTGQRQRPQSHCGGPGAGRAPSAAPLPGRGCSLAFRHQPSALSPQAHPGPRSHWRPGSPRRCRRRRRADGWWWSSAA